MKAGILTIVSQSCSSHALGGLGTSIMSLSSLGVENDSFLAQGDAVQGVVKMGLIPVNAC